MENMIPAKTSTIELNPRIIDPTLIENFLSSITERISRPPPDPLDLRIIPPPIPDIIPARIAASILSCTGIMNCKKCRATV